MKTIPVLIIAFLAIFLAKHQAIAWPYDEVSFETKGRQPWPCAKAYNAYIKKLNNEHVSFIKTKAIAEDSRKIILSPFHMVEALRSATSKGEGPRKILPTVAFVLPPLITPFTMAFGALGYLTTPLIAALEGISQVISREKILEQLSETAELMNDIRHYKTHGKVRDNLHEFLQASDLSVERLVYAYNIGMLCPSECFRNEGEYHREYEFLTLNEIFYLLR